MMSSGTPIASIVGRAVTMPMTIMDNAARHRQRHGRVDRFRKIFAVVCAEILRNNDRRAGSYADKKAYKQVDDRARRAHSRQRLGADKLTDNDRVNRVIQLLKKSADQDWKEEKAKSCFQITPSVIPFFVFSKRPPPLIPYNAYS